MQQNDDKKSATKKPEMQQFTSSVMVQDKTISTTCGTMIKPYSKPTRDHGLWPCAIATSCCISDVPSQWEGQNFDPHNSHIFQPNLMKLETKKDIRDTTPCAKLL